MRFSSLSLFLTLIISTTALVPDKFFRKSSNVNIFRHAATDSTLEYVTNSGICETTPGVNQYSGYLSVGRYREP